MISDTCVWQEEKSPERKASTCNRVSLEPGGKPAPGFSFYKLYLPYVVCLWPKSQTCTRTCYICVHKFVYMWTLEHKAQRICSAPVICLLSVLIFFAKEQQVTTNAGDIWEFNELIPQTLLWGNFYVVEEWVGLKLSCYTTRIHVQCTMYVYNYNSSSTYIRCILELSQFPGVMLKTKHMKLHIVISKWFLFIKMI